MNDLSKQLKFTNALELLTSNRFDIAVKLAFLHGGFAPDGFINELYRDHLKAFGFGQIREPGDQNKNSLSDFIRDFKKIATDIISDTFDFENSPIPVSKFGSIVNGSHRTASAIFAGKKIAAIYVEQSEHAYNYKFFHDRGMTRDQLDYVTQMYLKYAQNPRVALIWPKGAAYTFKDSDFFQNIIYSKEIKLNSQLLEELVLIAYMGESWLGGRNSSNRGFEHKATLVGHRCNKVRVVFFDANSDMLVTEQKQRFRTLTTGNKHAIHITDDKTETLRLAEVLLNENTLKFLKIRKFNATPNFDILLKHYKNAGINNEECIVVGSGPMAAFGLRDCNDIDYLTINDELNFNDLKINSHHGELVWYSKGIKSMVENPKNFFLHDGIKFADIELIREMKKNRMEKKDKTDLELINLIETKNYKSFRENLNKIKINLYFLFIRNYFGIRPYFFYFLKKIYLYNTARKIFNSLKNKK